MSVVPAGAKPGFTTITATPLPPQHTLEVPSTSPAACTAPAALEGACWLFSWTFSPVLLGEFIRQLEKGSAGHAQPQLACPVPTSAAQPHHHVSVFNSTPTPKQGFMP